MINSILCGILICSEFDIVKGERGSGSAADVQIFRVWIVFGIIFDGKHNANSVPFKLK